MKDTFFCANWRLNFKGKLIEFQEPIVMGILNITPDSFYAGSKVDGIEEVVTKVEQMIADGVTIVDIGGYSSRPGAQDISVEMEKSRVMPVITEINNVYPNLIISIDTFRAEVAEAAIAAGASMINDISGGQIDSDIYNVASKNNVPYVIMHMRGNPQNMQSLTDYDNILKDVLHYFSERIAVVKAAGVKDIIIDPGFGFSKSTAQNFELMKNFEMFNLHGVPLLAGLSRKSMIYKTLEQTVESSLNGTTVLNSIALSKGVAILRVHDVKEAVEAIQLLKATFIPL